MIIVVGIDDTGHSTLVLEHAHDVGATAQCASSRGARVPHAGNRRHPATASSQSTSNAWRMPSGNRVGPGCRSSRSGEGAGAAGQPRGIPTGCSRRLCQERGGRAAGGWHPRSRRARLDGAWLDQPSSDPSRPLRCARSEAASGSRTTERPAAGERLPRRPMRLLRRPPAVDGEDVVPSPCFQPETRK